MSIPSYAELHCLSNYTFLRGASHPEELIARAAELGYRALALTDECSFAGLVRAHQAAKSHGFKLIAGSEIALVDGLRLVLLAVDRDGYGELCELITRGRRQAAKGRYVLDRDDLGGGLPGCLVLLLPDEAHDGDAVGWAAEMFPGRVWIGVGLHRAPGDRDRLRRLQRLGEHSGLPLVAAGNVQMHRRCRRRLRDLLSAIRLKVPLAEAGYALHGNGEHYLRERRRLDHIYPRVYLNETLAVAERCCFNLDELRYQYPADVVPAGETPTVCLRRLTEQGMARRWPSGAPEKVRRLVERELTIITELGYEAYFLTVHDIVAFARGRGILCQGRGSAANSAVCYCLGITAVDPERMELLFERFVSQERGEPPDIDVDFEHHRREEVIQYVYRRYGRERAALAATVIAYRGRSALRDAGKALGFDQAQFERLAACADRRGPVVPEQRLREAGFNPANPAVARLLALSAELYGCPRHLSQHVGGFVISRGPLTRLVPIENAAMPARTVIQWDKDDLDAVGLLKIDCLGLGMLSALRCAFELIQRHRGYALTLATIPAEDPAVYRMIQRADTVGVFQIESRAQMSMLPRLRPANFYDLVVEVAIVRPGPIQGQMVHPYLRRRQGDEAVDYPSAAVRSVLQRTLGVPIFQEQVIKLAMVAAGFSGGEADQLRRAIGSWRKYDSLGRFRERLIEGMQRHGYSASFARQVYEQIKGFGEYGFPESHAASFAILVYASAWLKCHEPAVFTCALLNSQPLGFYAPAQLVRDARRHGVEVLPVDVRHSDWDCTLEPTGAALALRLGLRLVKGLLNKTAQRLIAARRLGPLSSVALLACRAQLGKRDLALLAAAGALAGLAGDRHQAHWQVLGVEPALALFGEPGETQPTPALPSPSEGEDLIADYVSLGLTPGRHPLTLIREQLETLRVVSAAQLRGCHHGGTVHVAGLVITRQRPASASGTVFVTLEDETGSINVIVWPALAERCRGVLLASRLLGVAGMVQRTEEVIHVIARGLIDHSRLLGGLVTRSRDFR